MVAMGYWLDGEAHIMMMLVVSIRIKNYRLDQMKVNHVPNCVCVCYERLLKF